MSEPATPSRRLPRGPQAPRPREDEKIYKQGGADLQNGWLGRHGTLVMTEDRLVFLPTLLDTVLRARRHQVDLNEVTTIERFPRAVGDPPAGGRRPRMLLHTPRVVYEFMVGDLDGWIDSLEQLYVLRARQGKTHRPEVLRDGHVNLFLTDE